MKQLMIACCLVLPYIAFAQVDNLELNTSFPSEAVLNIIAKKRKPVIIDFFSSTCALCFKKMPELKKIQSEYETQLLFVLLGVEDGKVQSVYHEFEKKLELSFPVLFDSVLPKQIGLRACPTYVWIGSEGKVKAVTGPQALTRENINRFLAGQHVGSEDVVSKYSYDPTKPFLVDNNGGSASSISLRYSFSVWERGQPIIIPPLLIPYEDSVKFLAMCVSLNQLYRYAFTGYPSWGGTSVLYGKVWPLVFLKHQASLESDSLFSRKYCIEIESRNKIFPREQLQQILRSCLNASFGFNATIKQKRMPCYYLRIQKKARRRLLSSGSKALVRQGQTHLTLRNQPISTLLSIIAMRCHLTTPIIDRTGLRQKIDIDVDATFFNFSDVQRALAGEGLNIVRRKKRMDVIFLRSEQKMKWFQK